MALILRYLCLKTVKIKCRSVKNFLLYLKSRYIKNSLTVLFVKLQAVRIRILFYVGYSHALNIYDYVK